MKEAEGDARSTFTHKFVTRALCNVAAKHGQRYRPTPSRVLRTGTAVGKHEDTRVLPRHGPRTPPIVRVIRQQEADVWRNAPLKLKPHTCAVPMLGMYSNS